MRLDHLLSKEHLGTAGCSRHAGSDRSCLPAAHGWNIDIGSRLNGSDLVRLACGVGTVWSGEAGTCTLLGPEGPDDPAFGWGDGFSQAFTEISLVAGGCGGSGRLLRTT